MKSDNKKFCAYGSLYKDMKGTVLEEGKDHVKIVHDGWIDYWEKWAVKIFDSEKERDRWIEEQNYQYDER